MAIDYSKWDKLELSDDSDVEVHPNVDKNSFIRWKQRDIHEKRMQRDQQIKGLYIQKEMYTHLNKRVDSILEDLTDDQIMSETERNSYLTAKFDPKEKCELEENTESSPTYNEMVEDLFSQMENDLRNEKDDVNGFTIKKKIIEHRQKIDSVLKQIDPKIKEFESEKTKNITSDDLREGWNSSIINKSDTKKEEKTPSQENVKPTISTTTTIETLNPSLETKSNIKTPSKPLDQLGELELLKETVEFSTLNSDKACLAYILEHPFIASTQQKDALLMKAFDVILDDKESAAEMIIYKGMLLQFASDLIEHPPYPHMPMDIRLNYVKQFFNQLEKENSPGRIAFEKEYSQMFSHIKARCAIIKAETTEEEEQVETIQLRSVDPDTKLVVTIPTTVDSEEYKTYSELPEEMKKALNTGSLDEVNKELGKLSIEEAEAMLEKFNKSGVIGVQALLDNEDQFKELVENEKKFEEIRKAAGNINLNEKLNEMLETTEPK